MLIAVTGLGLMLFLVGHLAGNLILLVGADEYNASSHALISNPFIYVVAVPCLVVNRTAFDRIQAAGGYVSFNTGSAPDATAIPIGKPVADEAFEAAACIGCGACVAQCKNASALLFTGAKISQLALLSPGPRRTRDPRATNDRPAGLRGLRVLLQRGRVRGGLPQGNLHLEHRPGEPRVPPGRADLAVTFLQPAGLHRKGRGDDGCGSQCGRCDCDPTCVVGGKDVRESGILSRQGRRPGMG